VSKSCPSDERTGVTQEYRTWSSWRPDHIISLCIFRPSCFQTPCPPSPKSKLSRMESHESESWGKCPHVLDLACIDDLYRLRHGCIGPNVFTVVSTIIIATVRQINACTDLRSLFLHPLTLITPCCHQPSFASTRTLTLPMHSNPYSTVLIIDATFFNIKKS
jgi:hypothetical protein